MEKKEKVNNFWFGFILGILFTAFFTFLFGTKKGRKILKNFLEYSEDYEKSLSYLLEKVSFLLKEKFKDDKKDNQQEKRLNLNFSEIIDRIKYLANPIKKQTKKFFVKEGKIFEKSLDF